MQLAPPSAVSLLHTLSGIPHNSMVASFVLLVALLEALLLHFLHSFRTSVTRNSVAVLAKEAHAPMRAFLRVSECRFPRKLSATVFNHFRIGAGFQISNIHRDYIGIISKAPSFSAKVLSVMRKYSIISAKPILPSRTSSPRPNWLLITSLADSPHMNQ